MLLKLHLIKKETLLTHKSTKSRFYLGLVTDTLDDTSPLMNGSEDLSDDSWTVNHLNRSMSGPDCLMRVHPTSPEFESSSLANDDLSTSSEAVVRRAAKTGSTAIKRRPGKRLSRTKIKRRCSINGHFYDRETSFFTPPHGSQMSVWVSSLVSTQEVINLMLEKYKVDSDPQNFALFVVRDNGGGFDRCCLLFKKAYVIQGKFVIYWKKIQV